MGFGVSGASAVIFLGLFVAAGTVYATTSNATELVSDAHHDDRERLLDRRNTALTVTDAVYYPANDTLVVTADNTGTHTLSVNATTVLVNNTYVSVTNATVDGDASTDLWESETALELTLTGVTESPDPDRVKVVTGSGVSDASTVRRSN